MVRKRIFINKSLMNEINEHIKYIIQNKELFNKGNGYSEEAIKEMKYIKRLLYLSESHHLLMEKQHRRFAKMYRLNQAQIRDYIEEDKIKEFIEFIERKSATFR